MKITTLALTGAACLALAAAAPAAADTQAPAGQALYPETVPGAGLSGVEGAQATIRHTVRGTGFTGAALFRVNLGTVQYLDPIHKITFTSLRIGSVRFVDNKATLQGIGLLNHRRVPFTAVGVHNELPGIDVFRISWNHGAGLGGRVVRGSLFIR
jgi:hypothetical protein